MDGDRVGSEYLDHLTDADLRLLASVSGTRVEAAALRREPGQVERLLRVAAEPVEVTGHRGSTPAVELLERLGTGWYRTAYELASARTARLAIVAEVAERFSHARRVLNHVADRYLFPNGGGTWLAQPG